MECVDKNKQTKKRCDCSVTQYAYVALQACFSFDVHVSITNYARK